MSDLRIEAEPYDGPVATALIAAVQAEYVVRYGGPDEAPVDATEFTPPGGRFLVGFLGDDAVACGGVRVLQPGMAEIKRMFVDPSYRGRGFSRIMLASLEDAARELGCATIRLETGERQPEAVALYASSGYVQIDGYGFYADAPLSICFGKELAPTV